MPTRWRSARMAAALLCSSGLLSTVSSPLWNSSSPLMQRSSVLLPEPLLPMMAITSPGAICRSMPLSTSLLPYDLRSARMSTMGAMAALVSTGGMQLPLQGFGVQAHGVAQHKIQNGHTAEHEKRAVGGVGNGLAHLGQLHETNHRGQRCALDDLHQKAHRGRHGGLSGAGHQ